MIVVFGSINMDLVARVRAIARPGETVLSRRADSFFGGKGANQAVAAARIGQGGPIGVAMAGAVGNDPFGQACLDNLRRNGVDTGAVRTLDEPTGCAFITVDETGENAMIDCGVMRPGRRGGRGWPGVGRRCCSSGTARGPNRW